MRRGSKDSLDPKQMVDPMFWWVLTSHLSVEVKVLGVCRCAGVGVSDR